MKKKNLILFSVLGLLFVSTAAKAYLSSKLTVKIKELPVIYDVEIRIDETESSTQPGTGPNFENTGSSTQHGTESVSENTESSNSEGASTVDENMEASTTSP